MKKLTYSEAYNLIIDAYFRDEIIPLDPYFCFCGTLSNGDQWCSNLNRIEYNKLPYSADEYALMEDSLLIHLIPFNAQKDIENAGRPGSWFGHLREYIVGYEDALFAGMCEALEVLKSIHEKRGEIFDENIWLKKRSLNAKQLKNVQ